MKNVVMADISGKPEVFRETTVIGKIKLKQETIHLIKQGKIAKGDPIYTSKVAGIFAAKKTSMLIPLCHPLPLANCKIEIEFLDEVTLQVVSTVKTKAQTGVEMEGLVATTICLLTIWDMVKQYEKDSQGQYPSTLIEHVQIVKKTKKEVYELHH